MRSFIFSLVIGLLCVPSVAVAQQGDFGRFQLGMTPAEVRVVAPEQQWAERAFGEDLILLTAGSPVRVGRTGFRPTLSFRDGRLESVHFQAGGPIQQLEQCDRLLMDTVVAVEAWAGSLNIGLSPSEFGSVAAMQTTATGSEIRFYDINEAVRVGVAVRRGDRYIEVSSSGGERPSRGLWCTLEIEMQAALGDFQPVPPPSAAELAAAAETMPDWTYTGGSDVTELTIPAQSVGYVGRVRVRLDCLVISEQRVNCVVESEEPQGMHFGDGAVAASRFYRIEPVIDGQPTSAGAYAFRSAMNSASRSSEPPIDQVAFGRHCLEQACLCA